MEGQAMTFTAPHPSWQIEVQCSNTTESRKVREYRRALRRQQAEDPLAKRERCVKLWRKCAVDNHAYQPHNGAWWYPFITQPGLMRFLLPGLRTHLQAKQDERRAAPSRQHEQAPQPNQQELFS
jgi:hypothetical protein